MKKLDRWSLGIAATILLGIIFWAGIIIAPPDDSIIVLVALATFLYGFLMGWLYVQSQN